MESREHIPGPWHLERQHPEEVTTAIGEPIAVIGGEATGEAVEFVVGRCCDFGPHGNEQTEANARLIAAAPETAEQRDALLEACKRMLQLVTDAEWTQSQRLACIHGAEAAIAKATPNREQPYLRLQRSKSYW